ncbi:MAG: anion permease, partial [Candidatus Enterenecus sp.]
MTVTVFLVRLLVLAVIFINGWTDAPNAIATAVGSGALSFRRAVWLAAGCNFAGAALSCLLFPAVAATIGDLVYFSDQQAALTALCAAMLSIVLWAVAAWRFGLPTSESHALLAGLSGAALALGGQTAALNGGAWLRVGLGLLLSLIAGALAARGFRAWLAEKSFNAVSWQRVAAGVMALLHGVQDGQKFLALLLMADGLGGVEASPSLPLLLLTAGVMALGTALGGKPIVEKVGSELAGLSPADGLAADLGAGAVLLVCSALGLPVSTTHAKVAAICGAGRHPDLRVAGEIGGAWALTFPCCAALAFG